MACGKSLPIYKRIFCKQRFQRYLKFASWKSDKYVTQQARAHQADVAFKHCTVLVSNILLWLYQLSEKKNPWKRQQQIRNMH